MHLHHVCCNDIDFNEACDRMLRLQEKCLHPTAGKPYIKASRGGLECSVEGWQVRKIPKKIRSRIVSRTLSNHCFEEWNYACVCRRVQLG
jgi:hypothetical protein